MQVRWWKLFVTKKCIPIAYLKYKANITTLINAKYYQKREIWPREIAFFTTIKVKASTYLMFIAKITSDNSRASGLCRNTINLNLVWFVCCGVEILYCDNAFDYLPHFLLFIYTWKARVPVNPNINCLREFQVYGDLSLCRLIFCSDIISSLS